VSVCAIIAAAGCGKRIGGLIYKQFLEIKKKPIVVHTLEKFRQSELVDSIVIVVPKDWYRYVTVNLIEKYNITKVNQVVIGGVTRQESVYNALKVLNEEVSTVVIHDAVRPLIGLDLLNEVAHTLNRDSVWQVQTPQVFKKDLIFNAYEKAFFNCITATDDSELIEYMEYPIHVVAGSRTNIKITIPEDLDLAEILLQEMY
jgi:2-C-methyl-D-erythritol 4-phosphate cytidylyltransferase